MLPRIDLTAAKEHLWRAEDYIAHEMERLEREGACYHITTYPTLALAAATAGMLAYNIAAAEMGMRVAEQMHADDGK